MSYNRHLPMPDTNAWPAYSLAWDDNQPGPTDVSFLLEKTAGATGFIKVVDGHLATGDGQRWRIWGQHFVRAQALAPTHLAPVIARRLAKFGVNCIRLHAIDFHWPDGILMRETKSSRSLDPEGLARLDWMVACLKEQGIYVDMNLQVARTFTAADGVKVGDLVGWGKPMLYFDDWMMSLQKEYARQLLDHRNPFTGTRYAEEPAVAMIEITNENWLSIFWQQGMLRGQNTNFWGSNGDIHPVFAEDLDRRWNAWLAKRYPGRESLAKAWGADLGDNEDPRHGSVRRLTPEEFSSIGMARFRDEATFYTQLEQAMFRELGAYIRGELGARQLILGSADFYPSPLSSGLQAVMANTVLDMTDSHYYWQHPVNEKIENSPMVDAADYNVVAHVSRGAVEGVPHICSEVNEPFPNDSAEEFIPILAAYARLQDWDGVFFYDYHPWPGAYWRDEPWAENFQHYWFDIGDNPVKVAQTALGALMFLRGDAQTARETVSRSWPRAQALETLAQGLTPEQAMERVMRGEPMNLSPYWLPYLPGRLALMHKTRITSLDAAEISPAEGQIPVPEGKITSDTGELTWETAPQDGRVLVDTPRQQAIIGRAGERETTNLKVSLHTPFAAIQLASLEDCPLTDASQMILLTCARVANTDQTWVDDSRQEPADWGHAPVRIEPVTGNITLRGLKGAISVTAQALDGSGQPTGEMIPLEEINGEFRLKLADLPAAPWHLIRVRR
ncbi:MAG: hypothetical protein JW750_11920 [Anaerolineaceae bacterium]|nr:hypothetical protein [Anaerolineaceae bacterium]